MGAPTDTVVLKGAPHPVVGHHAVLEADTSPGAEAAREKGAQLQRAPVSRVGADRFAVVAVGCKRAHDRVRVTGGQSGLVARDHVPRVSVRRWEYGGPHVTLAVEGNSAAIGAEHH